ESAGRRRDLVSSGSASTNIFIYPPFHFRWVDALLTNFHLPRSTLLMLVSAFASPSETRGRELILRAYHKAIHERYRFFTYADAVMSGARTVDLNSVTLGPGSEKYRKMRLRRGLAEYNLRVIVSGSGSIDPTADIFRHRFSPIIILTTRSVSKRRLERLKQ